MILTGLPRDDFFLRGGPGAAVCTQATIKPCPLRVSETYVNSFEHWTILEGFRNKKNEYHF